MYSNKAILQKLITVPKHLFKNAHLNPVQSVNSPSQANNYNSPGFENYKQETIKNYSNNVLCTKNVSVHNEATAVHYFPYSVPLEVYKKLEKVNHNCQKVRKIHQRTKLVTTRPKIRNFHQETRPLPPYNNRGGNKLLKQKSRVSTQNCCNSIFDLKLNSTLPPPTANNRNIHKEVDTKSTNSNVNVNIRNRNDELLKSPFNITMSKGKKVRPPSSNDKKCVSSGRVIKANLKSRKLNIGEFNILKNKEILMKFLTCNIHTSKNPEELKKTDSIVNLNKISKSLVNDEAKDYKLRYNDFFPSTYYETTSQMNDVAMKKQIDLPKPTFNKNRHFMKTYLRPVNIPPPTSKKLKAINNLASRPYYNTSKYLPPPTQSKQNVGIPILNLLESNNYEKTLVNEQSKNQLPINFDYDQGPRNVFTDQDNEDVHQNQRSQNVHTANPVCARMLENNQNCCNIKNDINSKLNVYDGEIINMEKNSDLLYFHYEPDVVNNADYEFENIITKSNFVNKKTCDNVPENKVNDSFLQKSMNEFDQKSNNNYVQKFLSFDNNMNNMNGDYLVNMVNSNANETTNENKCEQQSKGEELLIEKKCVSPSTSQKNLELTENAKKISAFRNYHSASIYKKQQEHSKWKKFKFPAPSSDSFDDFDEVTKIELPKFYQFKEAHAYFEESENLKKLSSVQLAMYNSIKYYENVIKMHAQALERQRSNLETTQRLLRFRKTNLLNKIDYYKFIN